MALSVREMRFDESDLIIDYFHQSTPEHLEMMGVDPSRLPTPQAWRERFEQDFSRPLDQRMGLLVIWLSDDEPIGFSTCRQDRLRRSGQNAPAYRRPRRVGGAVRASECVRQSVELYFDRLKLRRLVHEPNAFNIAPNRTLQKAGFNHGEDPI